MCNSWAFCIYQTLLKNLTDSQINQIKNLIKLILRLFCHVMALPFNNDKKNILRKKKKKINSLLRSTTSSTSSAKFFMMTLWNISPKSKIHIWATEELYGNSLILTQKNTCRGGLRALSNMPKLWIILKPLKPLAQNSNNIKKEKKNQP